MALEPNEKISTKSAYGCLLSDYSSKGSTTKSFNWIWKQKCPNKLKYFLLLCLHGHLPTKQYSHHMTKTALYATNQGPYSTYSFFSHVQLFWKAINMLPQIQAISGARERDWLVNCRNINTSCFSTLCWKDVFSFYLWNIWLTRNHNVYNDHKIHVPTPTPFEWPV